MKTIRPVSDLRNNFADISKTVHQTRQPVFLTKNGYGDMVVMSMEAFEDMQFESEIYCKLQDAEKQAALTENRFSSKEVFKRTPKSSRGMKYAIEYLPSAPEDLKEIVRYIAHTLQNPKAAERLWLEIIKKTDLLADFPYSAPRYLRETEHRFG